MSLLRLLLSCLILSFLPYAVKGQLPAGNGNNQKSYTIQPDFTELETLLLPFQKVVVIDSRFDTSKLGYMQVKGAFKKIITSGSFQQDIQEQLNTVYSTKAQSNTSGVLYIFIKQLWLKQTTQAEESRSRLSYVSEQLAPFSVCKAKLECYLQIDGSYTPLLRLDSSFKLTSVLSKAANKMIALPFQTALHQLATMDKSKKRKQMSWQEVQAFNNTSFRYARVQKDTLVPGLYLSFSDFLNNKVTPKEMQVVYGDLTDELYVIEGGEKKMTQEFWGYCDGEKHFIKTGHNFFELERVGKTYEYWGVKGLVQQPGFGGTPLAASGAPADVISTGIVRGLSHSKSLQGILRLFQLNMETGEPY